MMVQSKVLFGMLVLAATAGAQVPNLSARVTSNGSVAANVPPRYAAVLETDADAPPLAREFRGVWIATVDNIDWPSKPGLPVDSQKTELLALLDHAARLQLNAVIFQVRPAADAFYKSSLEPWSVYLTGQNGRAPSPEWDPLSFAIEESHKRGMELHAWFNPYRARYRGDRGTLSSRHISRTHPSLVKRYGPYLWMDPGEPAVRAHTTRVIMDVVRRYDIDGVHIDDYFYPYQERDRRGRIIPFPDNPSWTKYRRAGGKLDRDAWRRNNVDVLVEQLYGEIKKAKPWVKFGISPFGIWRPGYPAPIRGLDAYETLYADSRRWFVEGWLDYFAPQLYWAVGAPAQSYPLLLAWWADQNHLGRHLWPGNGTYKVTTTGSQRWQSRELLQQITLTRDQPGAGGNIHYNMTSLVQSADSLAPRLLGGPYQLPALVPASPWLTTSMPVAPTVTHSADDNRLTLRISSSAASPPTTPRWWLVRARYGDGWRAELTAATSSVITLGPGDDGLLPDYVVVNAIGKAGLESEPVRIVVN